MLRQSGWNISDWGCQWIYVEHPLQWRHNESDGVSNHQPHDCLFNSLFRRRSKKISKLHVTGCCDGNSPVTSEFPAQRASYAENVSIWWHHHDIEHHRKTCSQSQGLNTNTCWFFLFRWYTTFPKLRGCRCHSNCHILSYPNYRIVTSFEWYCSFYHIIYHSVYFRCSS